MSFPTLRGDWSCGFSLSFFFFSSRRRHTRFKCDWSSDVCSSDLKTGERILSGLFHRQLSPPGRSRARQVHHGKARGEGEGTDRAGTASDAVRGPEMIGMTNTEGITKPKLHLVR